MGERSAMLNIFKRGKGDKKSRFGQFIITKIIKIIATRFHILRLKTRHSIPDGLYIGHAVSETNKQY